MPRVIMPRLRLRKSTWEPCQPCVRYKFGDSVSIGMPKMIIRARVPSFTVLSGPTISTFLVKTTQFGQSGRSIKRAHTLSEHLVGGCSEFNRLPPRGHLLEKMLALPLNPMLSAPSYDHQNAKQDCNASDISRDLAVRDPRPGSSGAAVRA
jgi:hypothetical protein